MIIILQEVACLHPQAFQSFHLVKLIDIHQIIVKEELQIKVGGNKYKVLEKRLRGLDQQLISKTIIQIIKLVCLRAMAICGLTQESF